MANRTLAAIRKFFNWCIERDLIKFSPAYKILPPQKISAVIACYLIMN